MYDYSKLLGKVKENGFTLDFLAKEIGMNISTLSKKINNKSEFHQSEIRKLCKILNIDMKEIENYFFAPILRKTKVNPHKGCEKEWTM